MNELNLPVIEKTVHKTRLWLDDVMAATETMDRAKAFRALRAVLHALRDTLPVEANARFSAQMPLLIRGLYYEGWRPLGEASTNTAGMDVAAFVDYVGDEFGDVPTLELERICRSVFRVIGSYISAGEVREVAQSLPAPIREFLLVEQYRAPCAPLVDEPG